MQNSGSSQIIPITGAKVSDADLIQQLVNENENCKLRKIIDEMANTLAMQKELIQQLRDEIANLKGQKPKPKISPSKLEGPNSKPDWRKRIGPYDNQTKCTLFSLWIKNSINLDVSSRKSFSDVFVVSISKGRPLEISRLARLIIKKVRWTGRPGQPQGDFTK